MKTRMLCDVGPVLHLGLFSDTSYMYNRRVDFSFQTFKMVLEPREMVENSL